MADAVAADAPTGNKARLRLGEPAGVLRSAHRRAILCAAVVNRLAGAALLFAVVAGCDPGLHYVLPGALRVSDDGTRYVVGLSQGVDVRFHSDVFIQDGWVEIE